MVARNCDQLFVGQCIEGRVRVPNAIRIHQLVGNYAVLEIARYRTVFKVVGVGGWVVGCGHVCMHNGFLKKYQ